MTSEHLSPGMRNVEPYPFEELDRRKQEALDAGRELIDFGVGDPREVTPRSSAMPCARRSRRSRRTRARPVCRSCARRSRRGSAGASASTLDPATDLIPTLGSKELVFSLAQAVLDPGAGKDIVLVTAPGYTIPERGARFAGGEVRRLAAHRGRAFLPDLDAIDGSDLGAGGDPVAQLPEQPHRCHGAARVPRARRRRWRAVTTSCWRRTRRTASCGSTGDRPLGPAARRSHERRRAQHAAQALEHDGVPLRVHGRRPRADRGDEGAPPIDRRDAAGVRATGVHRGVERRGPRARSSVRDTRRSARSSSTCSGDWASRSRRAWRACTCGSRCPGAARPSRGRSSCWSGGLVVAPGSFFGPEGEGYVRMAMVATLDDCARAVEILERALSERRCTRERSTPTPTWTDARGGDMPRRTGTSMPRRWRTRSGCSTGVRSASPSPRTRAGS